LAQVAKDICLDLSPQPPSFAYEGSRRSEGAKGCSQKTLVSGDLPCTNWIDPALAIPARNPKHTQRPPRLMGWHHSSPLAGELDQPAKKSESWTLLPLKKDKETIASIFY